MGVGVEVKVKGKKRQFIAKRDGTPEQQVIFIDHCAKLINERIGAGLYDGKPQLKAALAAGIDPAVALIEIMTDQDNTPELRAVCASKLLPFVHKEQSLLVQEASGGSIDTTIQIHVAPWAAGPQLTQARPALPAPSKEDKENDPSVFDA
jgi:hypothetical protein